MKTSQNNQCPVCGSSDLKYQFEGEDILYRVVRGKYKVLQCIQCYALFIVPFPSEKETSKFYPKTYYSYEIGQKKSFFTKIRENIIQSNLGFKTRFSLLEQLAIALFKNKFAGLPLYSKENGFFLDIGCGNGSNLKVLKRFFNSLKSIPISIFLLQNKPFRRS